MNAALNLIAEQVEFRPRVEKNAQPAGKEGTSFEKMMRSAEESASYEKPKVKKDLKDSEPAKDEEALLKDSAEAALMNGRLAANIVQLPAQANQTAEGSVPPIADEGKIIQAVSQQTGMPGMVEPPRIDNLAEQKTVQSLTQIEEQALVNPKTAASTAEMTKQANVQNPETLKPATPQAVEVSKPVTPQTIEVAKQANTVDTGKQVGQPEGAKQAPQMEQASQLRTKGQEQQEKSDTGTGQKKSDTGENSLKPEMHMAPKTETLDMSKVNVKVSDGQVRADSPTFAKDVSEQILYKTQNGKTEFELQLNPRNLGNITIKMSFENGKASVLMECANPKAQSLLMGSVDQIKGIIEQQTGTSARVTVNQEQQEQAKQSFEGKNENQQKDEQKQRQAESYKNAQYDEIDTAMFLAQMRLGLSEKGGSI